MFILVKLQFKINVAIAGTKWLATNNATLVARKSAINNRDILNLKLLLWTDVDESLNNIS